SAMVSRSRLNRTRGPPDVLRICFDPLRKSQPGGWPEAGADVSNHYNFIHLAPLQAPCGPNQDHQNFGTDYDCPSCWPYSELTLALPSKTPAKGHSFTTRCCGCEASLPGSRCTTLGCSEFQPQLGEFC